MKEQEVSQTQNNLVTSSSSDAKIGYLRRIRQNLRAYRPKWRDKRFWILQSLTIFIVAIHIIIDFGPRHSQLDALYFLPASLLLIPVVFAALTYGFVGAITTAIWVVILTIPDLLFIHHGLEGIGVISELVLLSGIASLIGFRVDRERWLQKQSENSAIALEASTTKYRGLLESNPIAVLVVSSTGLVLEANPAALILFSINKTTIEGTHLADILGTEAAQQLLAKSQSISQQAETVTLNPHGRELSLEPRLTRSDDGKGNVIIQILLRDVTEESHRRAGLRAYAAEILRALEEERQLMARELHDETIQALILLCNQLDDAKEMAATLPSLLTKLNEARESGENIIKGLRDFAKALRPPALDDLGITISIRRLLAEFAERTKIEGQLMITGKNRRLPSNVELGLFRITQEALRNIERHAVANYVAVIITFTEHGIRLDVVDNGVGFSLPSASGDFTPSGQLGLISMQERAQLLGGRLEIQSSPGKGTKVTISIPKFENAKQNQRRLDI